MTKRRWIEYLIAVLAGNAMYFLVLLPGLPPRFQNQPNRFDLGLLLDFACCLLVYAAIRLGARHARRGAEAGEAASGRSATERRG